MPEECPWPFKNMDSVQYMYQNSGFQSFHLQDRSWKALGSALEHMGEASEPFLGSFGGSFARPDRSSGQQNSVFCSLARCSNDFLPSEAFQGRFWVVFGSTFGCSEMLFLSSFCLSELDFLEVFPKSVVVVTLCTSHTHLRHFASQLNVSTRFRRPSTGSSGVLFG